MVYSVLLSYLSPSNRNSLMLTILTFNLIYVMLDIWLATFDNRLLFLYQYVRATTSDVRPSCIVI